MFSEQPVSHAEDVEEQSVSPYLLPDDELALCDKVHDHGAPRVEPVWQRDESLEELAKALAPLAGQGVVLHVVLGDYLVEDLQVVARAVDNFEQA